MSEIKIELREEEWPDTGTDHDRLVVRGIVTDRDGFFYFVEVDHDDQFGNATVIETSGGGVEPGEDLEEALRRELREELGAEVKILRKIGVVSDYYNLIRRHNINHYYLCEAVAFGERHLTESEADKWHMRTLKLRFPEAVEQYLTAASSGLGRVIAARELPVLTEAAVMLKKTR